MTKPEVFVLVGAMLLVGACETVHPALNEPGTPTTYQDPGTRGQVSGVGIESQDIIGMTDRMMRDMVNYPVFAAAPAAPRVIIDSQYFYNESSERINKNIITDRLRVGLNRAARGRMSFVGRHYADMVKKERELKRKGKVDVATTGLTKAQSGADFRLGGRITTLDQRNAQTGMLQRYTQITFEMVDLESGQIVWSGIYEFSKAAQDDIIYR